MSLVRIALRTCLVKALTGKTLVGDAVRDSAIAAFDIKEDGSVQIKEKAPFISVYTDDGLDDLDYQRGLYGNGTIEISIEWGSTDPMFETNDQGEKHITGLEIPVTDASMEINNDLIGRQIIDTLENPSERWCELFYEFAIKILSAKRRRVSTRDQGVRVAAQRVILQIQACDDPVPGENTNEAFNELVEYLDPIGPPEHGTNTDDMKIGALIRAYINGSNQNIVRVQKTLGLNKTELSALFAHIATDFVNGRDHDTADQPAT